jgi:CBS domain-containing protein
MVSVAEVMTEFPVSDEVGETSDSHAALPDVLAYTDETCRAVAEEMATTGVMSMPVVDRESGRVCGSISAQDLLGGRRRAIARESERSISFQI